MNNQKPIASIYCIRNIKNGWVYIGATKNKLKTRLFQHLCSPTPAIRLDLEKYGRDAFTIELVEYVYKKELIEEIEDYWIDVMKDKSNGKIYNKSKSRYSSSLNRKPQIALDEKELIERARLVGFERDQLVLEKDVSKKLKITMRDSYVTIRKWFELDFVKHEYGNWYWIGVK